MPVKSKIIIACFLCLTSFSCLAQKEVTLRSLLQEMVDYSSVAKWPDPEYTEKQASSYDRRSVAPGKPGWFANDDASQYIRSETVNGHTEQVMLDVDGPGAVVRFWLTTFKRNGTLRIYFDNNPEPEITVPAYNLMQSGLSLGRALLEQHSSYEPKEKGGSTLYLPMPYAKHCKITFEDKDTDKQPRYYQINYRTYDPGTKVVTFTKDQLNGVKELTDEVNDKLLHPDSIITGKRSAVKQQIMPGNKIALKLPAGSSAIRLLTINIKTDDKSDYAQALRSIILIIKFDGHETVWCPVGDFSGSGVGGNELQSWYRTVSKDGTMISRWVMPYKTSASVTLLNLGAKSITASIFVITDKWHWGANSLYFHADWKNAVNVPIRRTEADKPIEWDFNSIKGKGIYLGDTFAVFNHMHKWYGEGDQKVWTDTLQFPVEYGTGAEDYYNTSWAPVVLYQTPFANAPRADNSDSYGYNTFTRTRNLDAVPFKSSFRFSLEMLGWENGTIDCAATTYWYGFAGAQSAVATDKSKPANIIHTN